MEKLGIGDEYAFRDNHRPKQVHAAEGADVAHWSDWTSVVAAFNHTCGLREGGTAWCWGRENTGTRTGMLGLGESEDGLIISTSALPAQVVAAEGDESDFWSDWVELSSNGSCGLRADGTLWCWGYGWGGSRGDGTGADRSPASRASSRPRQVVSAEVTDGPWDDWVSVAGTCGRRRDGSTWCWGSGADGTLGNGEVDQPAERPVQVLASLASGDDPWTDWIEIGASPGKVCGIREGGSLWCWGSTALGIGRFDHGVRPTPLQVVSAEGAEERYWTDWTRLWVGNHRTCAERADHSLWCWGSGGVSPNPEENAMPESASPRLLSSEPF